MDIIPRTATKHETASMGGVPPPPSPLPAGTRLVLEIPDPAAPGGFRVETPPIGALVEALAPAVVRYVAAVRAEKERRLAEREASARQAGAAPVAAPAPPEPQGRALRAGDDGPAPVCARCRQPKTRKEGGRYWVCTPCHSAAVSGGHQARRKAA